MVRRIERTNRSTNQVLRFVAQGARDSLVHRLNDRLRIRHNDGFAGFIKHTRSNAQLLFSALKERQIHHHQAQRCSEVAGQAAASEPH